MHPRLGVLLLVSVGVQAQNGPLGGTWKLNLAKSTLTSLIPPGSATSFVIPLFADGPGLYDGVDGQGQATHLECTAKFDGKDYPEKTTIGGKPNPNPNADAIAWKKIDDYTYESTTKLKGQVMQTTHYVISRDGKTRTNTVDRKNAQGQTVNNTQVYEKQ